MMNAVLVYSNSQTTSLFAFDYVKELRKDELEQSTLSIASGVCVCVCARVRAHSCVSANAYSVWCDKVLIKFWRKMLHIPIPIECL